MKVYLYLFNWLFHTYRKRKPSERIVTTNLAITLLIQLNVLLVYFLSTIDFASQTVNEGWMEVYHTTIIFMVAYVFNYFLIIKKKRYDISGAYESSKGKSALIVLYILFSIISTVGLAIYAASLR